MKESPVERTEEADHSQRNLRDLREAAVQVVQKLTRTGYTAYFAGGCVRDRLLNISPADYDIATSARPEQVKAIFHRSNEVGLAFGVVLVRVRRHEVQVATFRTDGAYSDGRHPDAVTFSDAEHDARRRDFTINGLFEDPINDRIIDYVGGQADLEARVLRAIGDPFARLREDRLRMLRAVRFAARFGLAIDPATADAIRSEAGELKGVSRERVGHEVRRMLSDANRAVAAWEMQYLGLDQPTLLEPNRLTAPTRVGRLPDHAPYPTALAGWLLDRHEPQSDDLLAAANRWADALMLSNDERAAMHGALAAYAMFRSGAWQKLGVAGQKRLAVSPYFDGGVMLLQATDRQEFVDVRRQVLHLSESGLAPAALIDGADLIAMGLEPGPLFSRVLAGVYDAQLEGAVGTPEDALRLARAIAVAESEPPAGGR
jgi:poly(A) polymerase